MRKVVKQQSFFTMIETVELDDYNKVPLSPGRGDV